MYDPVNNPSHYTSGKFECIDVMEDAIGLKETQDFCICNAFKYLFRFKKKNGLEDVKKARWYLDRFIQLEEKKNDGTSTHEKA